MSRIAELFWKCYHHKTTLPANDYDALHEFIEKINAAEAKMVTEAAESPPRLTLNPIKITLWAQPRDKNRHRVLVMIDYARYDPEWAEAFIRSHISVIERQESETK